MEGGHGLHPPLEEGLPCLAHHPPGDSAMSEAFSSVSTRPSENCRRFILLFLFLSVLCLAVVLSFVAGHSLVVDPSPSPVQRESAPSTTAPPSTRKLTSSPPSSTPPPPPPPPTPFHSSRLIPLAAVKNVTLEEVFVPVGEDEEWMETSHGGEQRTARDALLVPLGHSLRPIHYDLYMDITRFSDLREISANLSIRLMSYGNSTDDEIVFHVGTEVKLSRVRLRIGDQVFKIISMKAEVNKKIFRLLLNDRLKKAEYTLDIEYTAKICNSASGGVQCYAEPSTSSNGSVSSRVVSFTTKFEPALARSFLPCWDEPSVKSVFSLTVRHSSHLKVLSNTALEEERADEGDSSVTISSFKPTPLMSAYLLALAVGQFVPVETQSRRKIPITIWTFSDDLARASFAASFTPKMFDQHEEELEVEYPLSKLDMVAARGFPVGAMENWGLVVFDSSNLLQQGELEDSMSMTVDRHHHQYKIAKIITHELSHQWFGNLVTMRDWSELWLNEGFASFFVYEMLAARFPQLTEHEYFTRLALLLHKQSGLERPALVRSLSRESQVEAAFHTTHLYTKGCVVVRMIRDLVSPFDFSTAIRRYLRNNAYSSVGREDLFASLPVYADHGAENERLNGVLESWLLNEGMPEVTVSRKYDTDGIRVTQRLSRANRYRIFLYEDSPDSSAFSFTDNNSEEGTRATRAAGREFDDSLFDSLPRGYKKRKERRKERRGKKGGKGLVVERRAGGGGGHPTHSPNDKWSIPFSYMFGSLKSSEGQVIRQFWLRNRSISFTDIELPTSAPLLANPDWAYPYRVNYDYANWKMLTRMLHDNHLEIPVKSRMQLIVDGEFFLSQSGLPHLYIYLLGYLQGEDSLSVALLGLDAVHRVVEAFQGTSALLPLLKYLSPVVARMEKLMAESQEDIETAALWLVDPHRLTRFYQLRCAVNLSSCEGEEEVRSWFARGHFTSDMHQKTTALCHYLALNGGGEAGQTILSQLAKPTLDPTILQLATCVREEKLATEAARIVVAQRNAAVYDSVLRSDLSQQHYNWEFRRALWSAMGTLSEGDRRFLFSVDEETPSPKSVSLLHAVRSTRELELVASLLPSWGRMAVHVEFLRRQLGWEERVAGGVMATFFSTDSPTI